MSGGTPTPFLRSGTAGPGDKDMSKHESLNWANVGAALRRWHTDLDREVGGQAISFLESELRLMVPGLVRRTWPPELVEDAVRSFLLKLIEVPLPDGIEQLRAYIARAFRNHCVDLWEARQRRRERPLESVIWDPPTHSESYSPAAAVTKKDTQRALLQAFQKLDIVDRVALKLVHAPEWIEEPELEWLARRLSASVAETRRLIADAQTMYDITQLFDPGDDDPEDKETRRKRMERFRRRRARAREKLRILLAGMS